MMMITGIIITIIFIIIIIINTLLLEKWAMTDLASHVVIFRGVVLPSSPQTPAYQSSTFLSAT